MKNGRQECVSGFADIHAHFVYGMDDGAKTREDMEAMLDAAYADGITSLVATPHMTPGIKPFDTETFRLHLDEARAYCQAKGYPLALYSGAELLYTPALGQYAMNHRLPGLAGTEKVLVEFTPDIPLREVEQALDTLERLGYVVVMAHIERYACLHAGKTAEKLKERHDVLYQVNANTLLAERGYFRTRRIERWFREGLVDYVASDAHNVRVRPFRMSKAYRVLAEKVGPEEAARMTGMG